MKKDVRKKRPGFSIDPNFVRQGMPRLLKLASELETIYETYPRLRVLVGSEAWEQLTDIVYSDLMELVREPTPEVEERVTANLRRLEDIAFSSLVRDRVGLKDTLSRVLMFRIINGLATK